MKVCEALKQLNDGYFLPSIQREFVWKRRENKIEKLFDSILQKYPIGYITTWSKKKEINEELKFEIYEFGDQFDEDNPHNRPAITNGYKEVNLVLDGQQRLTALLIGLKGTYSYSHYNVKKVNKLYINLFSDIEDSEENVEGLKYEIKFFVNPPVEEGSFWLEIGKVLDFAKDGAEDFKASHHNNIIEKSKKDSILEKRAMKILGEIYNAFCERDVIQEDRVTDTDDDEKILNIFVRTNDGGMPLEKADLLLSYMEASKEYFKPKGARKEMHEFVDELNKVSENIPNYEFRKDDLLKATLVLSDLRVQYKLKNFNKENLEKISIKWPIIKKCLKNTRNLIARYGFSRKNITSKNSLIPISYYLMKNGFSENFIDSESVEDIKLKNEIINWLIVSTLKQSFGRSGDTRLVEMREGINREETFTELIKGLELSREDIEAIIEKEEYNSKYSHLILMLVTGKNYWVNYAQDHIHPQKKFEKENLKKLNLSEDKIREYLKYQNSIINLQLLSPSLNREKTDNYLSDWKKKKNKKFLEDQLIPLDINLDFDNFLEFIKKRKELLIDTLCKNLDIK